MNGYALATPNRSIRCAKLHGKKGEGNIAGDEIKPVGEYSVEKSFMVDLLLTRVAVLFLDSEFDPIGMIGRELSLVFDFADKLVIGAFDSADRIRICSGMEVFTE